MMILIAYAIYYFGIPQTKQQITFDKTQSR